MEDIYATDATIHATIGSLLEHLNMAPKAEWHGRAQAGQGRYCLIKSNSKTKQLTAYDGSIGVAYVAALLAAKNSSLLTRFAEQKTHLGNPFPIKRFRIVSTPTGDVDRRTRESVFMGPEEARIIRIEADCLYDVHHSVGDDYDQRLCIGKAVTRFYVDKLRAQRLGVPKA